MKVPGLLLLTCALTLSACGSVPPLTPEPVASVPPPTQTPPKLGMVEIEFMGGNTQPLQAKAVPAFSTQALTDMPCVQLGASLSRSSIDLAGKRYMQATFPVTNNCSTDLKNLTYVAVRRLGPSATLEGSAVTSMKTFGGTNAALSLASQILPTQPVDLTRSQLHVNQNNASLQVFDDSAGRELDGLQAQVDVNRTTYDLLPYGFVATTALGSRIIPAGTTGEVTFALSVPVQATPAEDVFSFRVLMSAATNSVTSITQGLEEQDAAGKAGVEARALALPGAEIRTLLGPTLTPATMARSSLALCQVRVAGPRSAPSARLVDAQGTLNIWAPNLPSSVGGAQLQPSTTLTVNGLVFPVVAQYSSLTPATLNVTNNLVRPVMSSPLARQTGTVQGSACGVASSTTVRTSPFIPLDASQSHSVALKADGTVVAWGDNRSGQTGVPAGLSGVVAVTAGLYHSAALKADGTVVGWGDTSVPADLSGIAAVSAGNNFNLALKADGTVVGWGLNIFGETDVPTGLGGVVAVAGGGVHSLALKADGSVVAWGNDWDGQTDVPADLRDVVAISAGGNHSLALKANGTVVAWGGNYVGQSTVPAGLSGVVAVSAGQDHSVALKADGTVVAWGDNYLGQSTVPAGLSGVIAVAAASYHNVALKADGTVVTWGDNTFGQTTVPAGLTVLVP